MENTLGLLQVFEMHIRKQIVTILINVLPQKDNLILLDG